MSAKQLTKRRLGFFAAAVLLAVAGIARAQDFKSILTAKVPFEEDPAFYKVKKVEDTKTLVLSNGERVRLIGVRAPLAADVEGNLELAARYQLNFAQVKFMAGETHDFLIKNLDGQEVMITYDEAFQPTGYKDAAERTWAYVVRTDGFRVNEEIIKQGYAFADMRIGYQSRNEFQSLERQARAEGRGVWRRNLKLD